MTNMVMAEETICSMFHDTWAERTPVIWPNLAPQAPHPREGQDPWVALSIQHYGSDQQTLAEPGRRTFTRKGGLVIQVFVPTGQRGLADATALAMAAANVYEGETRNGLHFYRVGAKTIGRESRSMNGNEVLTSSWFQINVTADFEFDEIK